VDRLQRDPAWNGNLVFNEYFHGDNGAGLGASHQTGWTGLVADLIRGRPSADGVYAIGDLSRVVGRLPPVGRGAEHDPQVRSVGIGDKADGQTWIESLRCRRSAIRCQGSRLSHQGSV
jgi:hypothetical protein